MRPFPLFVLLVLPGVVVAQPPPGYYDTAQGLTGEALRQALHDIIDDHAVLANSALWSAFSQTDRKEDNTVWDIYSDIPDGTPPYTFQFVVDQCGQYDGEGDCFNREHSFPQSWFNDQIGPSTDLFHMYPTDGWVNQKRANWPYGVVGSSVTYAADNGGKLGQCIYPGCSGLAFEPIDAYKGDLARGYFYLLTRYKDDVINWTTAPVLENGNFMPWARNLLLEWHQADPVSAKEVARNNTIYSNLQGNRNPYIDNPQWVEQIWGTDVGIRETTANDLRLWWDGDRLNYDRGEVTSVAHLRVFDVAGGLIVQQFAAGPKGSITFAGAPGVYMVRMDGQEPSVQRILR